MSDTRRARYLWAVLVLLMACCGLAAGGCSTENRPVLSVEEQMALWEKEGTVFRTGIMGSGGRFGVGMMSYAVSPDGTRILFSTNKLTDEGFWLLDLKSGHLSQVPGETGHSWSLPSWSRDGKQVVAVSSVLENDTLIRVWENELILLNSEDWSYRKLAVPLANYGGPSFSADGKFVFFLHGAMQKSRSSDRVRALYDLYAYDLASDQSRRLTHEEVPGMESGYDDGQEIFFSAQWLKRLPSMNPNPVISDDKQVGIYALNKASLSLRLLEFDQRDGFFNLLLGGKDKAENIYFSTTLKLPKEGGYARWIGTVYRCDANGQHCARLSHEIYFDGRVKIAYQTGDVFVDDRLGHEIVFRRLSQTFEVQK